MVRLMLSICSLAQAVNDGLGCPTADHSYCVSESLQLLHDMARQAVRKTTPLGVKTVTSRSSGSPRLLSKDHSLLWLTLAGETSCAACAATT